MRQRLVQCLSPCRARRGHGYDHNIARLYLSKVKAKGGIESILQRIIPSYPVLYQFYGRSVLIFERVEIRELTLYS